MYSNPYLGITSRLPVIQTESVLDTEDRYALNSVFKWPLLDGNRTQAEIRFNEVLLNN
jgi:hypothetical protein